MQILTVSPNSSLNEIIASTQGKQTLIHLKPGVYHQKLKITQPNIHFKGMDPKQTIISFDDYAHKLHSDQKSYNTFRTYTVIIKADHTTFENITIENTAGPGEIKGQAVALHNLGNHIKFINCELKGYQDTIFSGPLPIDLNDRYKGFLPDDEVNVTHPCYIHFDHCKIYGDVDFIFGSGTAYFHHCDIYSLRKGYITAPSTHENFSYGFIFEACRFKSLDESGQVYLSRPWRNHGSIHVINSTFEGLFHESRYEDWGKDIYHFYEFPYVKSLLSSPLDQNQIKLLKQFILTHFKI